MSPAPQRARPLRSMASFPYRWGYWLSLLLIFGGIVVAVFMVVGAVRGFVDDVNSFRRVVDLNNMELNLEEGEYLVFDEDGLDLGPFDVTVTRTSDGSEIPTRPLEDGTSYDVDGRGGKAKVSFDVPTSDIYRVEVDTSVSEVASFAVGTDVGNARINGVIRGLVLGALMVAAGLIGLLVTGALHARWKVRVHAFHYVSQARDVVNEVAAPGVLEDAQRTAVEGSVSTAKSWTEDRLERARAAVERDHGRSNLLGRSASKQAGELIDQAQRGLASAERAATEAGTDSLATTELTTKLGDALGRVQGRIEAGDRLRDIARDERAWVSETTEELANLARASRADLSQAAAEARAAGQSALTKSQLFELDAHSVGAQTMGRVLDEAHGLTADVETLGTDAVGRVLDEAHGLTSDVETLGTDAVGRVLDEAHGLTSDVGGPGAEVFAELGDEVGLAASAAALAAAIASSPPLDNAPGFVHESFERVSDQHLLARSAEPFGEAPLEERLDSQAQAILEKDRYARAGSGTQTPTRHGPLANPTTATPQVLPPPTMAPPPAVRPLVPPPTVSAQLGHDKAGTRFLAIAPPPSALGSLEAKERSSHSGVLQPPPNYD